MWRSRRSSSRSHPIRAAGFPGRILVAALVVVVGSACSNDERTEGERFCDDALAFQQFQLGAGDAIFDPERTEVFFGEAVERMDGLVEIAPPTVADDVADVRDAYVRIDRALAAADYSVIFADETALDTSDTADASERINDFLETGCSADGGSPGFGDDPFAPLVLTSDEIDRLRAAGDENSGEMEAIVSAQLAEEFGLGPADARCIVDGLDVSFISALAAGDPVSEADSDRFLEVLAECGVSLEQLTG